MLFDVLRAARLVREERFDGGPLKVREFISRNSRHRFASLNLADFGVRNVDFRSEMGRIADMLLSRYVKMTRMNQNGTFYGKGIYRRVGRDRTLLPVTGFMCFFRKVRLFFQVLFGWLAKALAQVLSGAFSYEKITITDGLHPSFPEAGSTSKV